MTKPPPAVCPFPDCAKPYQPVHADQRRCPNCARSLDPKTVASAVARANGQAVRPTKRKARVQVESLKSKKKPGQVVVPPRLTGQEAAKAACAAAFRALHDEPDPLKAPVDQKRWSVDVGMD